MCGENEGLIWTHNSDNSTLHLGKKYETEEGGFNDTENLPEFIVMWRRAMLDRYCTNASNRKPCEIRRLDCVGAVSRWDGSASQALRGQCHPIHPRWVASAGASLPRKLPFLSANLGKPEESLACASLVPYRRRIGKDRKLSAWKLRNGDIVIAAWVKRTLVSGGAHVVRAANSRHLAPANGRAAAGLASHLQTDATTFGT